MITLFKKLNSWIRNSLLDDVDQKFDGPLPYHKKFGTKKHPTDSIQERFDQQKADNTL